MVPKTLLNGEQLLPEREQVAGLAAVVLGDVRIDQCRGDIAMAGSISDLG